MYTIAMRCFVILWSPLLTSLFFCSRHEREHIIPSHISAPAAHLQCASRGRRARRGAHQSVVTPPSLTSRRVWLRHHLPAFVAHVFASARWRHCTWTRSWLQASSVSVPVQKKFLLLLPCRTPFRKTFSSPKRDDKVQELNSTVLCVYFCLARHCWFAGSASSCEVSVVFPCFNSSYSFWWTL